VICHRSHNLFSTLLPFVSHCLFFCNLSIPSSPLPPFSLSFHPFLLPFTSTPFFFPFTLAFSTLLPVLSKMLRSAMTDNHLNFFCLVNGESTSFPVEIDSTKTIGDLKDAIKAKKAPRLDDVAADELILWRVSIPLVPKKDRKNISLSDVLSKEELDETDDLSHVFKVMPPKKTIHIIVQRPSSG
ncbi:hypothetical protein EDD21DRAFT_65187, partial [Dissophora ornata]